MRAGFGSLASLAPDLSAICAEMLFRLPPRHAKLAREERAMSSGRLEFLPYEGGRLASWTFGEGPAVVTVHGWGGHAGRLSNFFHPLIDAGFSVVAFDAPGHGRSSGSLSSLPDFIGAVESVVEKLSGTTLVGAIGHSAGAAAIALAIRRGAPIPRAILLAPPANPEYYTARFAHYMGIPPRIREGMKRRLELRYGIGMSDLSLTVPSAPAADLLILHDRNDASVPWKEGAAIAAAWTGARLVSTRGLGHHKILRDPSVVATAVKFLATARRREAVPAPVPPRRLPRAIAPQLAVAP